LPTEELINELRRVRGKENILFRLAEAAVEHPDDIVREALYPVVGEETLNDLVREYKASGPTYRRTVQTTLKASYTNHYRRGLLKLLEVLEFASSNTAHRPVIDAIALLRRYVAPEVVLVGEEIERRGVDMARSGEQLEERRRPVPPFRQYVGQGSVPAARHLAFCPELGAGMFDHAGAQIDADTRDVHDQLVDRPARCRGHLGVECCR
jgi:hypothetical protein